MGKLADTLNGLIDRTGAPRAEVIDRMAREAGITASTVNQILRGEIERPPDNRLAAFARVLDSSLDHLKAQLPAEENTSRAVAIELAVGGAAPKWVQLFPASAGKLQTNDARTFEITDAAAVIETSLAGGRLLPIDFDHAIDLGKKSGQAAPAAGWIHELQSRPDGIWARVEWTPRGQSALAGREYRFLSPTFSATREGRQVTKVLRAALTNDPAFDMTALASANHKETDQMEALLKELAAALGVSDDDLDEATVLAAVQKLKQKADSQSETVKAIAAAVDGAPDDPEALVDKALAALTNTAVDGHGGEEPDPSKFVDIETFSATKKELDELRRVVVADKSAASVDATIRDGRLSPAQRDWAIKYCQRDPDGFDDFVGKQPRIVGDRVAPKGENGGGDHLLEHEKEICASLGLDHKAYLATRQAQQERHEEIE